VTLSFERRFDDWRRCFMAVRFHRLQTLSKTLGTWLLHNEVR
jgi:hypothetical protein